MGRKIEWGSKGKTRNCSSFQGRQKLNWNCQVCQHQRSLGHRAVSTGRHGIPRLCPHVLQPRLFALARTKGRNQKAEIRKNQRKENVHACWGPLQGISRRVRNVSQLLPRPQVWRRARLHVLAATVQNPVPHPQSSIRLHFRLDNVETESGTFSCRSWG